MTLWSGRFSGAPDADLLTFGASFRFDRRLFDADIEGSLAWAEALEAAAVLSAAEGRSIRDALVALREEAHRDPASVDGPDEDVHSFVERQLVARIGDTGKRLHTGRSRNEQVSVDLRLYLRRQVAAISALVVDLVSACADQAATSGDAVMPSYTHLRRAQPILVAHFWLSHATALQRDQARFLQAAADADALPLGSGAIAGTAYAIDTEALARRLGFSRVVPNSLDAVADRDFVATFLHACALTMVHLSRMAEDLIIFGSEEFGFFELDDRVATGSSLMPQKKNPDPLELIRGKSGRAIGHLTGWLTTIKGLPSGYNKDLQEDKEAVFDAEDTVAGCLRAMTTVVRTSSLLAAATEKAASGLLLATDVADYLVRKGMAFRTAHETVGGMVRALVTDRTGVRRSLAGRVARVEPVVRARHRRGDHAPRRRLGAPHSAVNEPRGRRTNARARSWMDHRVPCEPIRRIRLESITNGLISIVAGRETGLPVLGAFAIVPCPPRRTCISRLIPRGNFMEQRRLRPGDSLEDYCPRERRVTDHVVVAVVDDTVKQTRCAACDTEHPFKEGKAPPRKKSATSAGLVAQVLDELGVEGEGANGHGPQPALVVKPERKPARGKRAASPAGTGDAPSPAPDAPPPSSSPQATDPAVAAAPPPEEEGPVHRRLIRATLPRQEGQPQAPRPIPEFTMRQPGARGGTGFGRGTGAPGNRFGRPPGDGFGSPWFTKPNGHGGHRAGASAGPGGEPRGRQKGRSRGGRSQHKKAR